MADPEKEQEDAVWEFANQDREDEDPDRLGNNLAGENDDSRDGENATEEDLQKLLGVLGEKQKDRLAELLGARAEDRGRKFLEEQQALRESQETQERLLEERRELQRRLDEVRGVHNREMNEAKAARAERPRTATDSDAKKGVMQFQPIFYPGEDSQQEEEPDEDDAEAQGLPQPVLVRRKEGSVNPHGERLAFLIGQAVERIQQVGQPRRGGLDPEAADTLLAETVADLEAALTVRVRRLKLEGKQQEARQVADQAWDVVADLETQRARIKSLSRRKVRTRGTSETGTTPTKYARPRAAELASPAGDVHRPDFTFYGALPGPWAQPPQRRYRSCRQATDAIKFDGKAESYVGWRTGFLIATHRTTEPVDWKMLQLVKSIQEAAKSDHHLQRILQLSEYSETTYAMAIEIL